MQDFLMHARLGHSIKEFLSDTGGEFLAADGSIYP